MSPRLVVTDAAVLDPGGERFLAQHHLVIEAGRIVGTAHGPAPAARPGDEVIDAGGRYVLPGLIDAHFHLISRSASLVDELLVATGAIEGVVNAANRLAAGVTAVRDCGCRHHGIHQLKAAIEARLIPGPRAFVAGRNPTSDRAPGHWRNVTASGAKGMAAVVDGELAAGADWVKVILSHAEDPGDWSAVERYLGPAEIRAAVDRAHDAGVLIGAHCEGWEMADLGVRCGLDVLDHAPLIAEPVAAAMAAQGTGYVPTLWAFSTDSGIDLDGLPPATADAVRRWRDEHRASVARARAAGVLIAAGSDAAGSLPAPTVLVDEMEALADAGLGAREVLRAATANAATVLGQADHLGALRPGYAADVVIVDQDPWPGSTPCAVRGWWWPAARSCRR